MHDPRRILPIGMLGRMRVNLSVALALLGSVPPRLNGVATRDKHEKLHAAHLADLGRVDELVEGSGRLPSRDPTSPWTA